MEEEAEPSASSSADPRLLEILPPDGEQCTVDEAAEWLQTATVNVRYAYKFHGKIKVEIDPGNGRS
jgi:hypothetical protein